MELTRELPRNAVSAVLVLLLHAAIILALMAAIYRAPNIPHTDSLIEVLLRRPVSQEQPVAPAWIPPPRGVMAPNIPVPQIEVAPSAPPAANVEGVGRTIFGCTTENLATMTKEERAQCFQFSFGHPTKPSLTLGPYDDDSPYAKAIAKRNAPAVPMEHPCSIQESPTANLGLPCYNFSGGSNLLKEGQ